MEHDPVKFNALLAIWDNIWNEVSQFLNDEATAKRQKTIDELKRTTGCNNERS